MNEPILLPRALAEAMRQLAEAARPAEACGLLVGQGRRVTGLAPSRNLSDAADAFELDAAMHLSLQRRLRDTGRTVIGVWHSHPLSPARPSARDAAGAWDASLVWLITGTDGTRAWLAAADGFRELRIQPS